MALMPEFQNKIDDVYNKLQLSDERRALLQPIIEKNIHIVKEGNIGEEVLTMNIVDEENKKRNISLENFITDLHKGYKDDGTPVLQIKNMKKLSDKQLQDIAAGKLSVNMNNQPVPLGGDSIKGSEILKSRVSLEDVSSGKQKVDINF